MRSRLIFVAVGLALLAIVVSACGGGGGEEGTPAATVQGTAAVTPEGGAPTPSGEPVSITLWHGLTASPAEALTRLTDEFNASQDRITVSLEYQGATGDLLNKVLASLGSGGLPALALLEDIATQIMADSGAVVPVQDFIDAEGYDLSDFLPQVLEYYRVDGRLLPMPVSVSNPVLVYNKKAFEKAGLDPERPPATLQEVRDYSQKIVDAGVAPHGISLEIVPWYFEQFLAKAGVDYLNNGNGREARATEVTFDNEQGLAVFTWWKDMVDSGLALNVGRNPSGADHLLAIAAGQAEMTLSSSSTLRTVVDVVSSAHASGELLDIDLGTGPLPGLAGGTGGILVGGGGLYIFGDRTPEEQQAAWEFIKFMVSAESQAEWFSGSAYIPVRRSSYDLPAALEVVKQYPFFQVAADQLEQSPVTTATAGPFTGANQEIRDAVAKAIEAMLLQGKDPAAALADAAAEANAALERYNSRVE
jgi:sn-glycerol 3-phosphate transport system substrate-binding protein